MDLISRVFGLLALHPIPTMNTEQEQNVKLPLMALLAGLIVVGVPKILFQPPVPTILRTRARRAWIVGDLVHLVRLARMASKIREKRA
jgi:hypothetical protein